MTEVRHGDRSGLGLALLLIMTLPLRVTLGPTPELRVAEVLEFFLGLGAILGGAALMLTAAGGALMQFSLRLLDLSRVHSFVRPGVQVFAILIGVVVLMVAILTRERSPIAPLLAVFVGSALVAWIAVEMVVLSGASSLVWASSLVLGTSIVALGVSRFRAFRSSVTSRDGV